MRAVRCESCGLTFPEGSERAHAREHYEIERIALQAATPIKTDFPLRFSYADEVQP